MNRPMVAFCVVLIAQGASAQTYPPPFDPANAVQKPRSKDVPKMTTAEKNKVARDVNKQMVNPNSPTGGAAANAPPIGSPLTRDINQPGGRFGVDYYPRNGIVAPKAAPKSPKRD